jgi:hypothetical protein
VPYEMDKYDEESEFPDNFSWMSKTYASKDFVAKGPTCNCGLFRGPHLEK